MWQETEQGLYRKFEFPDFTAAFGFMRQVAELAEAAGHHPTWTNTYGVVEIWLKTHDADDTVTDKDRELAAAIDGLSLV